jgi:tetratricopeptide (TPR) repeat protein
LNPRIFLGAATCSASFATALFCTSFGAALAQSGTENYYFPPKIATLGKSSLPVSGHGKVIVKVLVHADGTFVVANVIRSTDPADNAVALDIAKHSTYHPAARGLAKKPVTSFYDFAIDFNDGAAAQSGSGGPLDGYESQLRAAKYADAETGLNSYLQSHPGDQKALLDLATAQIFQNDYTGAAASFDKVTRVPDSDKALAATAYSQASAIAAKANANDLALADAKKAVALSPGPYTYNALGMAEDASGQQDVAVTDLQTAHDLSSSLKTSDRVAIDVNLATALSAAGKDAQAKAVLAEIASLDPSNTAGATILANRDIKLAEEAETARTFDEAEGYWSDAAKAAPQEAGRFYSFASLDETKKKTPSADKAKALADMALAADPSNALANYVAGYALASKGKKTDALVYLNKADASAKTGTDASLTTAIENLIKQLGNQGSN